MRPPTWKRLLSYLSEIHIESAPSDLNPHLYVSLSRGRYQLATRNAIYSFEDLYDNFKLTFEALDWERYRPANCLLLGVGLGSIPQMLENDFHQNLHYTGVELDENVLYLAQKYVLSGLNSHFEMHCRDAESFVNTTTEPYDLICMDVFVDDIIPDELQTRDFLESLQSILSNDGLLLYNRLARTRDDISSTKQFMDDLFQSVFPEGGYLDVRGNWMLLNRTDFLSER